MAHDHEHHHHDHHHDHKHDHHGHGGHSHAPAKFNLAFGLATFLNLAFTMIEAGYALMAHSMGLLADAGHNLGDVCGLLMAWGTTALLSRQATQKYSYGFKKTTILSALANALLLVFTCAIILYESINKLLHPIIINEMVVMVVALIGIGINGGTALLFLRGSDDLNIKAAFSHLAYDALISVGVVIAAVIIHYTGWVRLDPIVGIIIVCVILSGTWGLLRKSVDLILDAVPHNVNSPAVLHYLSNLTGVKAVHDLHIWGLSTQENALTAHLVMPDTVLTDHNYKEINHILKHDFKINHVTLQIEKGLAEDPCGQTHIC